MVAKKIFISYSRRDTEYVSKLAEGLRKQGFDIWFDKNIKSGSDWDDTIEEQLKLADAIVLVLSKTSVASDNVKDEMSYAMELQTPIIPIKIEECSVPMRMARKQHIDFTRLGQDAGFEKLVRDLNSNLAIPKSEQKEFTNTFSSPTGIKGGQGVVKNSKRLVPYLLGGLVSIVLFIVVIIQCVDEPSEDEIGLEDFATTEVTDVAWEEAVSINTIDAYIDYIKKMDPEDLYFEAAEDSIDALLPNIGTVLYANAEGYKYFSKIYFLNMEGYLDFGPDDFEYPKSDDIIVSRDAIEYIWNTDDKQVIPGEHLRAGSKVRVLGVDFDKGAVWTKIAYADQ